MDPQNHTNDSAAQPLLSTDGSGFVTWSPSSEFFGQDFNTAVPFSPNEFVKFCNALSPDVEWPESKQEPPPQNGRSGDSSAQAHRDAASGDGKLKRPSSGGVFMGSGQGSEPDAVMEDFTRNLSRVKEELSALREDMDDMRSWLEDITRWSESCNDMLASLGIRHGSPQPTCVEPGCTCQYEGDNGVAAQDMETEGH
ncbi:hypothetical protein NpPPO83_00010943 [Neofusicoccum parvum]|uniref:Uncharacterized protein n=1 Tax=Neofusicoccum parvum TaxID=310453 RepID=A0ACB5SC91_9PEZI|nr:hypothetical protein NpPPO83_00010943 [Neofusicoccum parvum]